LASAALQALQVDKELSTFVRRDFTLTTSESSDITDASAETEDNKTVLKTTYWATTNRMLRVSVNGFMESIALILGVMQELDIDVLKEELGR
jgi:EKC/KEOPS complex subunit PCC1/LAGE3